MMKKLLRVLFILCLLTALVCAFSIPALAAEETALSATETDETVSTPAAEETDLPITETDVSVPALVVGEEFPCPTVAEDAGYVIRTYLWKKADNATVGTAKPPVAVEHYILDMEIEPKSGYILQSGGNWMVNGEVVSNVLDNKAYVSGTGILHIRKVFSLRTKLDRVEITVGEPVIGQLAAQTPVVSAEPDKYTVSIRHVSCYGEYSSRYYEAGLRYSLRTSIQAADGYEFSENCAFIINGQTVEDPFYQWYNFTHEYEVNLNQDVPAVDFPAFPESVTPGSGSVEQLPVPEGAVYTLQQIWVDLRTGEMVEIPEAGDVYTLAYVATPKVGYFFRENTVFTQNGEACEAYGGEEYRVIYKSYDFGATKIDRIDVKLPTLVKGYAPGAGTVPADANYTLKEILWAESATGSFADAQAMAVPGYGTTIYAIPVLMANKGYIFSEDVKLYFNGVEVAIEDFYAEGPALETAAACGTLTPPAGTGWYREDNTWAYYESGVKAISRWIMDSKDWCYVDANGLMIRNGWAKDSAGWCYLGNDGYIVRSKWILDSGNYYYLNWRGYMTTNTWVRDSRDWCYLGPNGIMITNAWQKDSYGWCYVGADGYMYRNNWAADSRGICRLGGDGYMVYSTWVHDPDGWRYVGDNGYMVYNNWVQYNGYWYAFDDKGLMYSDTLISYRNKIYKMDAYGRMLTNVWFGVNGKWTYVNEEGYIPLETWVKDGQGWCYISSGGYMLTECWIEIDSKWYYVDADGHRLCNTTRTFKEYVNYIQWKNVTYRFDNEGVATKISVKWSWE